MSKVHTLAILLCFLHALHLSNRYCGCAYAIDVLAFGYGLEHVLPNVRVERVLVSSYELIEKVRRDCAKVIITSCLRKEQRLRVLNGSSVARVDLPDFVRAAG